MSRIKNKKVDKLSNNTVTDLAEYFKVDADWIQRGEIISKESSRTFDAHLLNEQRRPIRLHADHGEVDHLQPQ
jgi:hypothetical protein